MSITNARLPIGGERVCQCSNCNEFFSSTNAFDVHQVRTGKMGRKIVCRHPETCGLEMKTTRTGDTFWGWPQRAHKLVQETFEEVGQ